MADVSNTQRLTAALVAEFGATIEAALGCGLRVMPDRAPAGLGWATPIAVSGALTGTLMASLDAAGASAIATRMLSLEDEPDESTVIDLLSELWTQAASATALKDGFEGLTLAAGTPVSEQCPAVETAWQLRDGETAVAHVTMTGDVSPGVAALRFPSAQAGHPHDAHAGADGPGNLGALLDIDLTLVVRFARTELSLRSLTMLGPGSMVDMGRSPDDPVQLLVGGRVIAEGEVVVVAGNYGVRITSLVSPAERLKAMEL